MGETCSAECGAPAKRWLYCDRLTATYSCYLVTLIPTSQRKCYYWACDGILGLFNECNGSHGEQFFCCCLTLGFPCQDNAMSSSRDANLSTEKENKAEKEDGDRCVSIDDFKTVHRQRQWRTWTFFYIKWCSLTRTLSGNITPCCLLLRPDLRGLIHLALISQIMKL